MLAEDADSLDSFRVANRAVARALRRRLGVEQPQWHPLQLAFILLNLPGLGDPDDTHRETVDLLCFPTGGGKTEAYLGSLRSRSSCDGSATPARMGRPGAGSA